MQYYLSKDAGHSWLYVFNNSRDGETLGYQLYRKTIDPLGNTYYGFAYWVRTIDKPEELQGPYEGVDGYAAR